MDNLFLTGFMGTGKTAVGRSLASRLGRRFVDLDQEIERAGGASVADIFARFGEGEFRERERRALERSAGLERAVVATGGGVVMDARNREIMHASGKIVCLRADPPTILSRVGDAADRPLLAAAADCTEKIRRLLGERAAAYADADYAVDTSGRSVADVVEEILRWVDAHREPSMREIRVTLGARSYPILIGDGWLDRIGGRVREVLGGKAIRAAIVSDSRVAPLYVPRVAASLREAGFAVAEIQIPGGEQHKNLAWLALTYDRLIEARIDRSSPVVAVGGGVVGDLAGFAAATILRGVPFVQVPTTLLAQVDASVGGKTGINHAAGKNLIGAFHQPRLVAIDVDTLKTLPQREYLSGLAEVVKYGAILDAELFARLEASVPALLRQETGLLGDVIATSCRLKAMVVEEDETEGGYRAILNFGHTLGHAIETLTEYRRLLHGEAVAIGMVCAARLSRSLGWLDAESVGRIERLLDALGLPTRVPGDLSADQLALAIEADKKAAGGKITFVCLEAVGRTRFEPLSAAEIAHAL
ncbi:MAG: 3-dehydroquinate synthase [Deltaproteobacteria bacterium]|nr:3-dehydroquinate synthase [Deltaproteobacteria bacterium]